MKHLTRDELEAGLADIQASPSDDGRVEMIVRRPRTNEREVLEAGVLDPEAGLVGDKWRSHKRGHDPEYLAMQLTLMNARAAALVAQSRERWALAGDQLYVDLDLADENLPRGRQDGSNSNGTG